MGEILQLMTRIDTKIQRELITKHPDFDFVNLKVQSSWDFVGFYRELLFINHTHRERRGLFVFYRFVDIIYIGTVWSFSMI